MRKIGYYLSIAFYDIFFKIFFVVLVLKLLLFDQIIGIGISSFYSDFGLIIIMLAFSLIINNRFIKITYLVFVNITCSLIFLSNSLYRNYFEDFASIHHIHQLPLLINVADSVTYLIDKELLFVLDFLLLPFLLLISKNKYEFSIKDRARTVIILLLLGFYCNFALLSYIKSGLDTFNFGGERSIFVDRAGIINYQILDIFFYATSKLKRVSVTDHEVHLVKNWLEEERNKRAHENNLTSEGKGHNVIIIQVESLQNFVIERRHNGKEITPYLNNLVKKGIYFNNFYDQTAAGGSSDATFLANASLYPARKGAVSYLYPLNCFDSLPKILKEKGYMTVVMHPNIRSFWNSETFEKSLGFEHQFYKRDFVIDDRIGLGLSDRSFLDQSLEKIKELQTPFYVLLRTLTAHFPYDYVTEDIDDFPLGYLEGKILGNYMRTMHYIDSSIGEFLKGLSEYNLLSTSVVIIYGDHRARIPEDELEQIGVHYMKEKKKVPLIINPPDRKQQDTRETVGGLIDIAPTISNILGIDVSDAFFIGRDLAHSDKGFVLFRDGSYIGEDDRINAASLQEHLALSDLIVEKNIISLLREDPGCAQ